MCPLVILLSVVCRHKLAVTKCAQKIVNGKVHGFDMAQGVALLVADLVAHTVRPIKRVPSLHILSMIRLLS